ncbi:MAG: hypothetical protein OEW75_04550 [Cyclobacteriaceae bacterium]|nr:hypothetical protein [Cyclobacteriaceae bacterium]
MTDEEYERYKILSGQYTYEYFEKAIKNMDSSMKEAIKDKEVLRKYLNSIRDGARQRAKGVIYKEANK